MLGYGTCTRNAAFFTILEKNSDILCIDRIESLFDAIEENPYWVKFGYKYLAMLGDYSITEIKCALDANKEIKNKFFATSVIEIYYGEVYPLNSRIVDEMREGIRKFSEDIKDFSFRITLNFAISGLIYLANSASQYDLKNIYEAVRKVVINGETHYLPVTPHEQYAFGIVYPWPGTDTAETELLARVTKASQNIDFKCVMLSDFGQVLDDNQHETDEFVKGDQLDYVMTTHYESHKSVDSYYYHLLWNPPDIPLNTPYYDGKVLNNYIMNDDYLIYDFGGMSNHLKSILINKPRTIEGSSTFVGSFPKSVVMEPNLNEPKLFYCGMNWEKALGNSNRHAGLFELLDKTGKVKFYGPDIVESWGGIRPWEGYNCYQHSIPFDGFSILKEINSCGICLAISSDAHRRAGAVTNRAYEACAAGAVIISDNNVFMEKYFGDSVLYVTYNKKNPQDTFNQIMEKYQWVVEHKEEALEMARKSQNIFVNKFCMEKGILDVTKRHYGRFKTIEGDLFAKKEEKVVLITQVLNTQNKDEISDLLQNTINNIQNQYYRNIILGIVCDYAVEKAVSHYAELIPVNVSVMGIHLFDEKGSRCITDGQAIRNLQQNITHDYFMNTKENETWFYDHITTLVRVLEDNAQGMGAYSGILSEDEKGIRRVYMFENLTYTRVYHQNHPNNLPTAGQFLFKSECIEFLPDYMLGCIDGLEHVAYVALIWFRYHFDIIFSKRTTCVWRYNEKTSNFTVIDCDRQIRFVRGLVKYDIPSNELNEAVTSNNICWKEFMLTMPLMQSINVRFWRKLSIYLNNKRKIGEIVYKIYQAKLNSYNELMDKING